MNSIKKIWASAILLLVVFNTSFASHNSQSSVEDDFFNGMWTLSIEDGSVGWINIHNENGYLDAELLWRGGSVLPVSHIYFKDENNAVLTRTQEIVKSDEKGKERKHILTQTLNVRRDGDHIKGEFISPSRTGNGESILAFSGVRLPPVPPAPDLSKVKYGKSIVLFNGKNIEGWEIIGPNKSNGFKVQSGNLVNDPVQKEGEHISYGNLRTTQEFEDFNLSLEVNVPSGNNSGVYLKGMYEIQVFDSYGKDLDSHNMGAVYSRITPMVTAEKPGGEWQSLDITLCQRHVTVLLNGIKIIDNQPVYGPTGGAIIADVFAPGPIYLQGDHGNVSYRNIVLKPIVKY